MAVESVVFLHVMISLGILLFAAKLMAELFHKVKLPIVLGELLAGIIVGPFALGALPLINGEPLVVLDETVRHVGEIAAVVILFIAGLEITPREFLRGGAAAFTVGSRSNSAILCRVLCIYSIWNRSAAIYSDCHCTHSN
jgi:Kef-type K+ transport system membrane component KefB